jgi:hypothetical protein
MISLKKSLAVLFSAALLTSISSCSTGTSQASDVKYAGVIEQPTGRPQKLPELTQDQLQSLKEFSPEKSIDQSMLKNSAEVFASDNFRAYAYNEATGGKITTYMYGGASEENQHGRWFFQRVFEWDPATKQWKPYFESGLNFASAINKDIPLRNHVWYFTAQWVWDPLAKEWIKFDSNLLFQNS